jgi:hypothetical protein
MTHGPNNGKQTTRNYILCNLLRRQRTDDNPLPFVVYTKTDDNEEEGEYKEQKEGRRKRGVCRSSVVAGNACSSFW